MAGSNRKKKRKTKVSKGIHGATRTRLTEVQKALLGGGLVASTRVEYPKQSLGRWFQRRQVD